MLPAAARLRHRSEFQAAVRGGSRAGKPLVSGHLLVRQADEPARVGFIVEPRGWHRRGTQQGPPPAQAPGPRGVWHRFLEVACLCCALIPAPRRHARRISPPNSTWLSQYCFGGRIGHCVGEEHSDQLAPGRRTAGAWALITLLRGYRRFVSPLLRPQLPVLPVLQRLRAGSGTGAWCAAGLLAGGAAAQPLPSVPRRGPGSGAARRDARRAGARPATRMARARSFPNRAQGS